MDEDKTSYWKIILIFGVLIGAVFVVSVYIQTTITTKEVNQNEAVLVETKNAQNDFRNHTLDYLSNINETVTKQQATLDSIQENIIHLPLVNNSTG
jgi:cell division protein FtsL